MASAQSLQPGGGGVEDPLTLPNASKDDAGHRQPPQQRPEVEGVPAESPPGEQRGQRGRGEEPAERPERRRPRSPAGSARGGHRLPHVTTGLVHRRTRRVERHRCVAVVHQRRSDGSAAPQERQRWPIGMPSVSEPVHSRLTGSMVLTPAAAASGRERSPHGRPDGGRHLPRQAARHRVPVLRDLRGLRSSWDYGPLGIELKRNVASSGGARWSSCATTSWGSRPPSSCRRRCGRPAATSRSSPTRWSSASTAISGSAPTTCRSRRRAATRWTCPNCGQTTFTEPRNFNLMFRTNMGPVEDAENTVLPAPRDRAGDVRRLRHGPAGQPQEDPVRHRAGRQVRSATRSRPGTSSTALREFEQMEMEFFVEPGTDEEWHEYWIEQRMGWWTELGIARGEPAHPRARRGRAVATTRSGPSTSSTGSRSRTGASSRGSRTGPTST